jgi:hypothetical protein
MEIPFEGKRGRRDKLNDAFVGVGFRRALSRAFLIASGIIHA